MIYQILVTIKIATKQAIEIKRFVVPVKNDYELETYLDDLDLRFDCILNKWITLLTSSVN